MKKANAIKSRNNSQDPNWLFFMNNTNRIVDSYEDPTHGQVARVITWKEGDAGYPAIGGTPVAKGDVTTSEGMGYGMRCAIEYGDQASFDLLWNYVAGHLNANGLMDWAQDQTGQNVAPWDGNPSGGSGAATDADQDIAFALVRASQIWGGNPTTGSTSSQTYQALAQAMIASIRNHEVSFDPSPVLKDGDNWQGPFHPDYVDPFEWMSFKIFDNGNDMWDSLSANSLGAWAVTKSSNIQKLMDPTSGLVPDQDGGTTYGWNAARVPLRLAQYYQYLSNLPAPLSSDQQSEMALIKKLLNLEFGTFYRNRSPLDFICSGYDLTGTPNGQEGGYWFNGPVMVAIQIMNSCHGLDSSVSKVADADLMSFASNLQASIRNTKQFPGMNIYNYTLGCLSLGVSSNLASAKKAHGKKAA